MTHYSTDVRYDVMKDAQEVFVSAFNPRTHERNVLLWTWKTQRPGEGLPPECLMLLYRDETREFFQAFLDKAWGMGLRPAHYDEPREAEAIKAHLQDMRTLVFKKP